jgi:hypothetical protein
VDFSHTRISLYIIAGDEQYSCDGWGARSAPFFMLMSLKRWVHAAHGPVKIRPLNSVSLFVVLFVCLSVLAERCFFGWNSTVIFKMTRERD